MALQSIKYMHNVTSMYYANNANDFLLVILSYGCCDCRRKVLATNEHHTKCPKIKEICVTLFMLVYKSNKKSTKIEYAILWISELGTVHILAKNSGN
jgi:hypothetical protein